MGVGGANGWCVSECSMRRVSYYLTIDFNSSKTLASFVLNLEMSSFKLELAFILLAATLSAVSVVGNGVSDNGTMDDQQRQSTEEQLSAKDAGDLFIRDQTRRILERLGMNSDQVSPPVSPTAITTTDEEEWTEKRRLRKRKTGFNQWIRETGEQVYCILKQRATTK